jgi:hypothetical protein
MTDALIFIGLLLIILLCYLAWKLRGKNWIEYFKTEDGIGILRGIVLAPIVILLIAAVLSLLPSNARAGTWVNDASVFVGIDYTNKLSPSCQSNTVDDRGTSNLGARLNLWQSNSLGMRVNSKYTHHSCVLGADDRQYDALGIELDWKVWER